MTEAKNKALLIGICGAPGSGKSEVQRILSEKYEIEPIDDGWPLRVFVSAFLDGLDAHDMTKQEVKAQTVDTKLGEKQIRWLLGDAGVWVENIFGPEAIPEAAIRAARSFLAGHAFQGCSFGSVRRTQGAVYRRHGGYVIEVLRPGQRSISGYEFDSYDRRFVSHTIINDGTLQDLSLKVDAFAQSIGINPLVWNAA